MFGLLLGMDAKPPFSLYHQGEWQYGVVRPMSIPQKLPVSYDSILGMIMNFEKILHEDLRYRELPVPERLADVSMRIFFFYLACFPSGKLPHMTHLQEDAMAAAFILMGLGAMNDATIKPEVLLEVFDVSPRRLENSLKKILSTMQKMREG